MKLLSLEGSNFETEIANSQIVKVILNGKDIKAKVSAMANVFGVNKEDRFKEKVLCCVKETKNSLNIYSKSTDLNFPRWIGGASTLRIGEGIWGPKSGLAFKQVKNYKKIETLIDFKQLISQGNSNLSYDIWLTKEDSLPDRMETTKQEDLEIMIILNSNFKFPWEKIMETEYFDILYENKNKNKLARDKGHCVAFVTKNKMNFDILDMISICSDKLKIDFSKHYIRSFDIIKEFAKNTESEAKITKLEIDLTEEIK
jgi:hypothetical protein